METIVTIIQTLGFPIACVIGMGYFIFNMWDRQTKEWQAQSDAMAERCQKREDKLYEQINRFNDTLNSFNETLIRIDTRLEVLEKNLHTEE